MDPVLSSLAVAALRTIWAEVDERIAADAEFKREHPCEAATFHRVMSRTLPWYRPIAKLLHRNAARRWGAWCSAHQLDACKTASDTATRLVREGLRARKSKGGA